MERFSKMCNVSVKILRYYDEIDLLKPSYIDVVTNYRYYDYDKIEAIKIILFLKRLHIDRLPVNVLKKSYMEQLKRSLPVVVMLT
ncbi:MAG: MerR family transcriptional regulator [Bacillota bacterium]